MVLSYTMGYVLIQGLLNNKASPRACMLVAYFGKGSQETEMEGRREAITKRGKAFVQTRTKKHTECASGWLTRGTEERGIYLWVLPSTPPKWDVNSFSLLVCTCVSDGCFQSYPVISTLQSQEVNRAGSHSSGAPGWDALQLHLQEAGCYSSGWNTRWAKRSTWFVRRAC